MDTSETYIRMCDCPEVRDLFRCKKDESGSYMLLDAGTWVAERNPWSGRIEWVRCLGAGEWLLKQGPQVERFFVNMDRYFILPRQDQLQQMITTKDVDTLLNIFGHFLNNNVYIRSDFWWRKEGTRTMEQLWLQCLMLQKYGKRWDDSEGWKGAENESETTCCT